MASIGFLLLVSLLGLFQEGTKAVARIGNTLISASDLETAAGPELIKLRMQRQQILEGTLNRLITEKILDLEAADRGIPTADFLKQEVDAKITEPPLEEVNQVYEMNKARIKDPPEKVIPKIRESLINQQKQGLYAKLVEDLKVKYKVQTFLEPLRIPVETAGHPSRGPADAPVTIIVFSDFECPYCVSLNTTLTKVMAEDAGKVRIVFRHFPLDQIHPRAGKAAEASFCAEEQGKFWEMHDELFKDRSKLAVEDLKKKAEIIGLDAGRFDSCLSSGKYAARVKADSEAGRAAGVGSTPTMFINGRPLIGAQPYQEIVRVIDAELSSSSKR